MATRIDDYDPTYEQAMTAYVQQEYEVAATLVDQAVQNSPDDPNSHLLRGHIYYVLQQYDIAKAEYEQVLHLTNEPEITSFAHDGLENIHQYLQSMAEFAPTLAEMAEVDEVLGLSSGNGNGAYAQSQSFHSQPFGEYQATEESVPDLAMDNPFDISIDSIDFDGIADDKSAFGDDPFTPDPAYQQQEANGKLDTSPSRESPSFWSEDVALASTGESEQPNYPSFTEIDLADSNGHGHSRELNAQGIGIEHFNSHLEHNDLTNTDNLGNNRVNNLNNLDNLSVGSQENWFEQVATPKETASTSKLNNEMAATWNNNSTVHDIKAQSESNLAQNGFEDDSFDIEAFESAFGADSFPADEQTNQAAKAESSKSNIEFLDDFDDFDDLGNIPGFELSGEDSFSDVALISDSIESKGSSPNPFNTGGGSDREEELFTITGSQEAVPVFTQPDISKAEPVVNVEPGLFSFFENASLDKKQWYIGGMVGMASAIVVAIGGSLSAHLTPVQQRESVRNTAIIQSLVAGLAGGAIAGWMSNFTLKQIRRTTKDLQAQFDAVRQGSLNVQATVYSEDELGYLAAGFNDMARVIFTTTNEAQRKAEEQEEAKENLQRQVIRLLDDVEGAARGDLTVQAEVTADVLGAVADAFNLTIQNLRDIVQQVKEAARDVTKGATNSETFARALSRDALRQAEELAVTLNSVQVMTRSIERVATAAKEAETVARDASAIALKGGEAVENTVAGILEIRETVAETTRKVKRLAESSQEISKIVALISQIASRTNLLALNASIEAARAGEAGRGFAIVADEVRQLADKSAKSLKEIEQIVMQIQSETGSVMTAMEEGTQQVIKGTKLAEEAKRSLEDIIQVAKHIDGLVRSITTDTVQQTETSSAVAQVMQSVELTAQETSQEAQRVSGALQHLVGVSRDLISSVERFRVETAEPR
ncbi:MAG TPA: methyl-accepting chemotaxis protein [Nostocaceae cyanobacterium]|nr:methyl-accepting chemotaxis protein [Nostocaceae cyanobacterium]